MFETVLIANRGEIACRVARTCRRLGVKSVAVYSEADADTLHVRACDEARSIGPPPAAESYLDQDAVIAAAQAAGADAVHPGYGFLAENAAFAEACAAAGLTFIGPPPAAIHAMGSKSTAKALMEDAGVPLLPGYHGDAQEPDRLAAAAERIGYPVLIKAAAGGGGKGMRRVDEAGAFSEALAAAQREANSAFGDARMLVEKCLLAPRHVEIQVFADAEGNVVHLFERDCSVQRRHQKVVEEAPAPGLSATTRQAMADAAIAAARAVGYVGAGTVELIMASDGAFYFMEMNTRLQVEHPVTEMITGVDLVAWQLRVAAGEPLPCAQTEIKARGHAIEARLYAEDTERGFLPAPGTIQQLILPEPHAAVRVDSGVVAGDTISVHYDPMIAKLTAWGETRERACRALRRALAATAVTGTVTNLAFLRQVIAHPAFVAGAVNTGFIADHHAELIPANPPPPSPRILAVAALYELLAIAREARAQARTSGDPGSPWHDSTGWRLNGDAYHRLYFRDTAWGEIPVTAHYRDGGFLLELPDGAVSASATAAPERPEKMHVRLDGTHFDALVLRDGDRLIVNSAEANFELAVFDPLSGHSDESVRDDSFAAPMPGNVVAVHVKTGDRVADGDALVVLEAMKMEYTIYAFAAGVVDAVWCAEGTTVAEGAELLHIDTTAGAGASE